MKIATSHSNNSWLSAWSEQGPELDSILDAKVDREPIICRCCRTYRNIIIKGRMLKRTWEHRAKSISNQMQTRDMEGDGPSLVQAYPQGPSGLLRSLFACCFCSFPWQPPLPHTLTRMILKCENQIDPEGGNKSSGILLESIIYFFLHLYMRINSSGIHLLKFPFNFPWPWANYISKLPLCLDFLICKMRMIVAISFLKLLWRLNEFICKKRLK